MKRISKIIALALGALLVIGEGVALINWKHIQPADEETEECLTENILEDGDNHNVVKIRCTSNDKILVIESGTPYATYSSPGHWTVWKIKTASGEYKEVEPEKDRELEGGQSLVEAIYTITKSNGEKYYIVNNFYQMSRAYSANWLEAYKIEGESVKQVNVMDFSDYKGFCNELYIETCGENVNGYNSIEYDAKTKNIYVPLFDDNILEVWHFNGTRFELTEKRKGKEVN